MSTQTPVTALTGARIFDGEAIRWNRSLLIAGGRVLGLSSSSDVPADARRVELDGLFLTPGFVDSQANGGGGALVNREPTAESLARIADAHARAGTTALLPTVITDEPAVTDAACDAVADALGRGVPGIVGIHMEGPHISPKRPGIHRPDFIRPIGAADLARMSRADLGRVLVTLAPEEAGPERIRWIAARGVVVSAGHSEASFEAAREGFAAGVRAVTHLFNAMSPFASRAPGLVGAALLDPNVYCGVIADGHHVHPSALELAFRARPASRMILVSDAMPVLGTEDAGFELNGRPIRREDGRLLGPDGTLAGADLDLAAAVRFAVERCGVTLEDALRMASLVPARLLGLDGTRGHFRPGARADIVALSDDLRVRAVWRGGEAVLAP